MPETPKRTAEEIVKLLRAVCPGERGECGCSTCEAADAIEALEADIDFANQRHATKVEECDGLRERIVGLEKDHERLEWLAEQGVCWRDHEKVDRDWRPGEWLYRGSCMNFRAEIDRHIAALTPQPEGDTR